MTANSRHGEPLHLCVDLDGTLIRTDLSAESLITAVKRQPWIVFMLPLWLLRGKAALKSQLARRAVLNASALPYNVEVISLVEEARKQGRRAWLVTSAHQAYAESVQAHLGLFDGVIATTETVNLTGRRKARMVDELLGSGCYEYVAHDTTNLPIRRASVAATTADAPAAVVRKVAEMGKPHRQLEVRQARSTLRRWLTAIRIHQWAKNALVFVPLVTAHALLETDAVSAALAAFVAMGFCASATYIVNDLFDLEADRHHPTKRNRPFAAGTLSVKSGMIASVAMLAGGALIALQLPVAFRIALGVYLLVTLLYSLRLKRVASLDVLLLAGLYTLRVIAGAWAANVALSFWLLAFSMFIFLCLALVKRVAELIELQKRQLASAAPPAQIRGREYAVEDIPILQILGATSGYLAVLVLALYINSPEVAKLYATPELLWLIAPLMLLWVTRLWVVTTRGYMDDDPIFFAIKDPETWLTALLTAIILVAATELTL